jgi:DNA-binding protein H-NS
MPTYQEYQDQIAKLQSLAEQARQDEIAEARRQVRELMQKHNLNVADLTIESKKTKPGPRKGTAKAKYRDPETGATWSGRGRAPRWLNGRVKDDFLIK